MEQYKRGCEEDLEYIRPYPRTTRACDPCRTRKIRCLPGEKGAGVDVCRRCATYGYRCTYTPTRSRQPRSRLVERDDREDKDIVPGLCSGNLPKTGELSEIINLHRRVFQETLSKNDLVNNSATVVTTPESINQPFPNSSSSSDSSGSNLSINMKEAERLLSLFRKRKSYFPFIEICETTPAASMAIHRPFLLLAILTVASSRMPRLQQRTDERFRRVLSERVVLRGEQGLDYVQGLLVYIAWLPLHLHPIRHQLFQLIGIAKTMITDLELDSLLNDTTKEVRDTCLGCFSLASQVSGSFQRQSKDNSEAYFRSILRLKPHLSFETQIQYFRVHELAGRVTCYTPSPRQPTEVLDSRTTWKGVRAAYPDQCSPCDKSDVRGKVEKFNRELASLMVELSREFQDKTPIRLTLLFIRLNIAFIPLKPPSRSRTKNRPQHPMTPAPDYSEAEVLEVANACFSDIKTFLEAFLSIPLEEWIHFSTREWFQLIITISIVSHLCVSRPETDDATGWDQFQSSARANMLLYLERLTHRMGSLSVSSRVDSCPDGFYMFKSVLGILVQTFATSPPCPLDTSRTEASTASDDPAHHAQNANANSEAQSDGSRISRCPVMNGSIRQTDFWRALEQNTPASDQDTTSHSGAARDSSLEGYTVADLLEAPQDWPSIFSEWVDLSYLPE
ncbi:hypothetical protein BJX63DRAFT_273809 [Aspergillus granulosus]|uniref:Zn(2)-C6 fungal-type domain-containing protein n=1 Tax=Aspergillus granulosus TaxID=176169 RepID=A0ABR4H7X9_9EURO